jgi:hypothetical protein
MSTTTDENLSTFYNDLVVDAIGYSPYESLALVEPFEDGRVIYIELDLLTGEDADELFEQLTTLLRDEGIGGFSVAYFTEGDPRELAAIDSRITDVLALTNVTRLATVIVDHDPVDEGPSTADPAPVVGAVERREALTAYRKVNPYLSTYLRALGDVEAHGYAEAPLVGAAAKALTNLANRDAVFVHLAGEPLPSLQELARDGLGEDLVARAMANLLDPVTGTRPLLQSAAHEALLEVMVAHLPAADCTPAHTLLAILAWWTGDNDTAYEHLESALTADPHYRLAQLIGLVFAHGNTPGWTAHA